ncbi:molybdopterin molybdotransferase MoeA [Pararhodonellum marinum]|uniref:molybdopterin molybdotransferase MoeA n=1 Tax=Pararhodonellum marinum TaxID=2755358 RepID=UPI00188E6413|nr:gephyrin-like molybdotransferase Glp [Pararhodonellum marinum]
MISVSEAKAILSQNLPEPIVVTSPLDLCLGKVLAADLYSPISVPLFDNAAMDGYAFAFADYEEKKPLKVSHVVQAGAPFLPEVKNGEAARIFTGAPVPPGTDTVVMQEICEIDQGQLKILSKDIKKGENIRLKGSQTKTGELIMEKGLQLNPAMIGFLAGLGLSELPVYKFPNVVVLTSGKELVLPGKPLLPGQIYESNSYALRATLAELGITATKWPTVDDEPEKVRLSIKEALVNCDVLLITGGISVGEYDFVQAALEDLGVEKLFYKVKQKPGKPLYAGKKGDKLVFGLPGNPASTLTCFYQYVKPSLLQMMGKKPEDPISAALKTTFQKKEGLTQFMKGRLTDGLVHLLTGQESYKMNSFAVSNCLVELPESDTDLAKGTLVKVHLLQ